jgi:hypothetical protein
MRVSVSDEGSDCGNFWYVAAAGRLVIGSMIPIQSRVDTIINVKIVIGLPGTAVDPRERDLYIGKAVRRRIIGGQRNVESVGITRETCIAPRAGVELAQPERRLVRLSEWAGCVADGS